MFTSGVLDVFMQNGIKFDAAVGVSAGVLFGCNYKSNQPGRALRYNIRFKDNPEYMSWRSLFRTGNYVNDDSAFRIQGDVIRSIAENGPAIFMGRCADYILRDMNCLNVFITAPDEDRIGRISGRLGISADEAESMMSREDYRRETYYNYFTFGHWGVASNYDLCIDSSILGIEGTADMIIEFGRRAGKIGGGEK